MKLNRLFIILIVLGTTLALSASAAPLPCDEVCDCMVSCNTACLDFAVINCGTYGICIGSDGCAPPTPSCSNLACTSTINGTSIGDTITATPARECINGLDGNDTISGDAGDDRITGGNGDDTLYGGSGNDCLWGDAGNDHLDGGTGTDFGDGGTGTDVCVSIESLINCP